MSWRIVRSGARDLEVCEVDELREGGDKRRDIRRSVEERWVLLDEEILHLPASILGCLVFRRAILRVLNLRLVDKLLLFTGLWIDKRR